MAASAERGEGSSGGFVGSISVMNGHRQTAATAAVVPTGETHHSVAHSCR